MSLFLSSHTIWSHTGCSVFSCKPTGLTLLLDEQLMVFAVCVTPVKLAPTSWTEFTEVNWVLHICYTVSWIRLWVCGAQATTAGLLCKHPVALRTVKQTNKRYCAVRCRSENTSWFCGVANTTVTYGSILTLLKCVGLDCTKNVAE